MSTSCTFTPNNPDAHKAEQWMIDSFDTSIGAYIHKRNSKDYLQALKIAAKVIENSGLAGMIAEWISEDAPAKPGRQPFISASGALTLMTAQGQFGGAMLFTEIANNLGALTNQTDPAARRDIKETLTRIGIRIDWGQPSDWYDRIWRSFQCLQRLMDPLPANRHRIPNPEQFQLIRAHQATLDQEKLQKRLDEVCQQLLEGSVMMLPREVRRRHKGNHALDATFASLWGKRGNPNPGIETDKQRRRCINIDGGWYTRLGDHDGSKPPEPTAKGKGKPSNTANHKFGIEIEIAVWVPNAPGVPANFPLLVTGTSAHRPGQLVGEGHKIFKSIKKRGYESGYLLVDRAYPNGMPDEFHGPITMLGHKLVFDYRKDTLGIQTGHLKFIQVEGQWYMDVMPDDLINAYAIKLAVESENKKAYRTPILTRDERAQLEANEQAAEAIFQARMKQRKNYRLIPKGKPDTNGRQRYHYPDPANYLNVDKLTGQILPYPKEKSITIPISAGMKHAQVLIHRSDEWTAVYGMRSIVEGTNAHVKDSAHENIEDPGRRRARGTTFAYLAITLGLVAANIRKIFEFINQSARDVKVTAKTRSNRVVVPRYVAEANATRARLAAIAEAQPSQT